MSETHPFRDPAEELEHLQAEMAEIRDLLRDIAQRVNRIDRHVKRAFGVATAPSEKPSRPRRPATKAADEAPSISPAQALEIFDGLTTTWKNEGGRVVDGRLAQMSVPDLKVLARELGVTIPSNAPRKILQGGIIGRVNES